MYMYATNRYIYTHTHTYIYIYIYIYMCVHIHTYICVYALCVFCIHMSTWSVPLFKCVIVRNLGLFCRANHICRAFLQKYDLLQCSTRLDEWVLEQIWGFLYLVFPPSAAEIFFEDSFSRKNFFMGRFAFKTLFFFLLVLFCGIFFVFWALLQKNLKYFSRGICGCSRWYARLLVCVVCVCACLCVCVCVCVFVCLCGLWVWECALSMLFLDLWIKTHIYMALLRIHRALLRIHRALLRICK